MGTIERLRICEFLRVNSEELAREGILIRPEPDSDSYRILVVASRTVDRKDLEAGNFYKLVNWPIGEEAEAKLEVLIEGLRNNVSHVDPRYAAVEVDVEAIKASQLDKEAFIGVVKKRLTSFSE